MNKLWMLGIILVILVLGVLLYLLYSKKATPNAITLSKSGVSAVLRGEAENYTAYNLSNVTPGLTFDGSPVVSMQSMIQSYPNLTNNVTDGWGVLAYNISTTQNYTFYSEFVFQSNNTQYVDQVFYKNAIAGPFPSTTIQNGTQNGMTYWYGVNNGQPTWRWFIGYKSNYVFMAIVRGQKGNNQVNPVLNQSALINGISATLIH